MIEIIFLWTGIKPAILSARHRNDYYKNTELTDKNQRISPRLKGMIFTFFTSSKSGLREIL